MHHAGVHAFRWLLSICLLAIGVLTPLSLTTARGRFLQGSVQLAIAQFVEKVSSSLELVSGWLR